MPDTAQMSTVSDQLMFATATSRNTNPGEMVPVKPGSFTLNVDAMAAKERQNRNASVSVDCHNNPALAATRHPAITTVHPNMTADFGMEISFS
jgi:hypothetical protein